MLVLRNAVLKLPCMPCATFAEHRDLHSFPTRRSSDLACAIFTAMLVLPRPPFPLWTATSSPRCDSFLMRRISLSTDPARDRKSTRLNSSHLVISYAVFCLKKKKRNQQTTKVDNETRDE